MKIGKALVECHLWTKCHNSEDAKYEAEDLKFASPFRKVSSCSEKNEKNSMTAFFKKWTNSGLFFFYFHLFNTVDSKLVISSLPKTGFEPRTSGVGSDHSTNWATTTARQPKERYKGTTKSASQGSIPVSQKYFSTKIKEIMTTQSKRSELVQEWNIASALKLIKCNFM